MFARRARLNRRGVGQSGGAPEFNPSTLSGNVFWLRADLGITLNGAKVSAWADQSTGAHDATQATPANQLTYAASVASLNNQAGLLAAAGSGTIMNVAGTVIAAAGSFTFFSVCRPTAVSAHDYVLGVGGGAPKFFGIGAGNRPGAYDGTNLLYCPTGYAANTQTLVLTYQRSGTSLTIRANGPTNTVTNTFTNGGITGAKLCDNGDATGYFTGYVAEYIAYNRILTAPEITQVEAYLATRYGVTLA